VPSSTPPRECIDPAVFQRPPLSDWAVELDALQVHTEWPGLSRLEALRLAAEQIDGIARPRFVAQSPALLGDGLHYEQRIQAGQLATRERNWHDLLNGLIWLRYPRIKWAMNRLQCEDIGSVGPRQRTRAQCAMTHFDEAGAVILCSDPALIALWDRHDWRALFGRERGAWGARIAVLVFGHAILELALQPERLLVAKTVALEVGTDEIAAMAVQPGRMQAAIDRRVAALIEARRCLCDPQELRPLPLSGVPGWNVASVDERFFDEAPCFRPLRPGRRYPAPA
jgi:hypothetical protein